MKLTALSLAAALFMGHTQPLRAAVATAPSGSVDKIDPAVRAAIDSGQTVSVIVLGRTQLLSRPSGLEEFQRRNATRDRLALRREVLATLRLEAEKEQRRIIAALGKQPDRSLWIVNAMVMTLTAAEVRRAERLDEVAFVYPQPEPATTPERVGTLSGRLPHRERPPFSARGKRIGWNVERLGAARVWNELGVTGEGSLVAVLDGGANYGQDNLRDNIWVNDREIPENGIDDDHNGYVDDVYGYDFGNMRADVRDTTPQRQHGTWTSGIIAGDGTDGIVTGVAPRARIMLLISGGPASSALAYQYALENGADVMSMSFSIPGLGNLRGFWRMMSDHAVAAGLVLVGGAGNFQQSAQIPVQHQSPKDVPSVISVGGVDSTMHLVPFSSMGPVEWKTVALYGDYPMPRGLIKPDLVAFPGPDYPLLATTDTGYIDPNPKIRGNSFSGPQGAGVAALMLSAMPSLPAWRVKEILEQTAHDLEEPGKDNRTGAGLIDAFEAVRAARESGGPSRR